MRVLFSSCGKPFYVDDDIAEMYGHYSWRLKKGYLATSGNYKDGCQTVLLHRLVVGVKDPKVKVDHIDCNLMNCTRANLRMTDCFGNAQNKLKQSGKGYHFKGVVRQREKWQAQIYAHGESFYLGLFESEHEAAHEYNKAAIVLHGEFARLNPVGIPHDNS